ncbi:MAG TPA: chromate transporter [Rhodocyclaceae bacterium]|nr:chromate transporter [Rhodocyclaceae bacterium]
MSSHAAIAWTLFSHFAMISMMAIGGGVITLAPDMQRFVVDVHHWMSDESFVAAFTIAQASPGPNFLFATLVGLQAAGWIGALAATVAIVIPPAALTIVALRASVKHGGSALGRTVKAALSPLSVGMMLATAWSLARVADDSRGGALLTALTVAVVMSRNLNPVWLIGVGALVGVLGWI